MKKLFIIFVFLAINISAVLSQSTLLPNHITGRNINSSGEITSEQQDGIWSESSNDWDITNKVTHDYSMTNMTYTASFYKKSGENWIWDTYRGQKLFFEPELEWQQKQLYCFGGVNQIEFTMTQTETESYILYTDFEPDTCKLITSSHESDFTFDIDHDGTVDMTLSGYTQHGAVLVHIAMSNGFQLCRSNENTILNADTINWFHNDDLSNGFPLDSYRKRYGFRKTEDGHHFFGWMEIYWDGIFVPEGKMIYLDRMAFCTIPDYPLIWGQTNITEGIEENKETIDYAFTVYPNPTNGVLFVETQHFVPLPDHIEYRIANMMGQTLLQGHITDEIQQINIENLPAGMYFISVGKQTMKFVVR